MKIWLLAENWPPRIGGIEKYLQGIVSHLNEEVFVIAPQTANHELRITNYGPNVVRRRFYWPVIRPAWLPLFVWIFRKAKRKRPDVLLCGKALFEGLVGYYLKKHLNIPYVVFTYAMEIEAWAKVSSPRRKLERVLGAADRVVYINEVTKRSLIELGVSEKQLVKIWPGIDALKPSDQPSKPQFQTPGVRKPYILAVGRLIARKGFDDLIEAFAGLDKVALGNYQLVIVGEGPERERLQELVKKWGLEGRIVFTGGISDEELNILYEQATIFALTPKNIDGDFEGFGIVYLEAGQYGLASVATASGGAAEAVIHNETGLVVEPGSPKLITEAMARLLDDVELRQQLGEAAKRRVEKEFLWEKRIDLVQKMLENLVR